ENVSPLGKRESVLTDYVPIWFPAGKRRSGGKPAGSRAPDLCELAVPLKIGCDRIYDRGFGVVNRKKIRKRRSGHVNTSASRPLRPVPQSSISGSCGANVSPQGISASKTGTVLAPRPQALN